MSELTAAQKKAFMEIPLMKEIKKNYMESQKMAGSGKRKMKGGSWWSDVGNWFKQAAVDVDAWLKRTKALSTIGKVVGAIGMIPPLAEFAPVGAAMTAAGTALGYGKKMKAGRKLKKTMTANDLGQHVNPVAGQHSLVSQGMGIRIKPSDILSMYNPMVGSAYKTMGYGTMAQNYQSPSMKMLGGATYPSHLQPFLTTAARGGVRGGSAALAVGSIGDATRIKF